MESPLKKKFQHILWRYILLNEANEAMDMCDKNSDACCKAKSFSKKHNCTIHIYNNHNDEIFGSYTKGV